MTILEFWLMMNNTEIFFIHSAIANEDKTKYHIKAYKVSLQRLMADYQELCLFFLAIFYYLPNRSR